jgi:hypothetical protein
LCYYGKEASQRRRELKNYFNLCDVIKEWFITIYIFIGKVSQMNGVVTSCRSGGPRLDSHPD